jgi:hypothetical protein
VLSAFRAWAGAYGAALRDAEHAWTRTGRAQAWFDAAVIARKQGMEIMGYEQDPDYTFVDGAFNGGAGVTRSYSEGEDSSLLVQPAPSTPLARAQRDLPDPFVTDGERERYAASEAQPYQRFHYRYVAVAHAQKAADLLPPRSQAFAAVLCTAANWTDSEKKALYQRYVKEGAYVAFAANFGSGCEQPDFPAAARFPYVQAWKQTRYWVHHHWWIPLGVVMLAGLAVWYRRRRQEPDLSKS